MTERVQRPRSGRSAKALLLTVLGEFVRPNGGEVWTSTLIRALEPLGISEPNARQAASRLADDGIITASKHGRATRWTLSPHGEQLLSTGAERIYGFGASSASWDGQWLIVLTSVPEEMRAKRLQIRSQLGFAGFGFLNAGTAISPHTEREAQASEILTSLDLDPPPLVFISRNASTVTDAEIIDRAWDLDALGEKYIAFIDEFAEPDPADGGDFVNLVHLVHEWRRFPFEDPEIPAELLPVAWPGPAAKSLFDERRAAWTSPSQRWFRQLEISGDSAGR